MSVMRLGKNKIAFTGRDKGHDIEAWDVGGLRDALGDEILVPFAQLFFWSDRLAMLAQALDLNGTHLDSKSVASRRNHIHIAFFTMGVLSEASIALESLEDAGLGALVPMSRAWSQLVEMRGQWRGELAKYRNICAFHADVDTIKKGLEVYKNAPEHGEGCGDVPAKCSRNCKKNRLPVSTSDGARFIDLSLSMGAALTLGGFESQKITRKKFLSMLHRLAQDHGKFTARVYFLFLEVLHAKGMTPADLALRPEDFGI